MLIAPLVAGTYLALLRSATRSGLWVRPDRIWFLLGSLRLWFVIGSARHRAAIRYTASFKSSNRSQTAESGEGTIGKGTAKPVSLKTTA